MGKGRKKKMAEKLQSDASMGTRMSCSIWGKYALLHYFCQVFSYAKHKHENAEVDCKDLEERLSKLMLKAIADRDSKLFRQLADILDDLPNLYGWERGAFDEILKKFNASEGYVKKELLEAVAKDEQELSGPVDSARSKLLGFITWERMEDPNFLPSDDEIAEITGVLDDGNIRRLRRELRLRKKDLP